MGSHQKDFCATCVVSIFSVSVWLAVGYWNAVWRQVKLSLLSPSSPLSLPPSLPFFLASLPPALHPTLGMQHHFEFSYQPVFPPLSLSLSFLCILHSLVQTCPLLYVILHFEPTHNSLYMQTRKLGTFERQGFRWECHVRSKQRVWKQTLVNTNVSTF